MAADIRPARASDVDALSAIEDAVFDADRISKKSFRRLIESRTASVLVAADGRAIDGYCIVLFRAGSRKARLYSIAVRPGSGHAGLGRALLGAAEQEATKRGAIRSASKCVKTMPAPESSMPGTPIATLG